MDGNELRDYRRRYKMTQGDLAKFLGVSRQTVNAWEQGRHQLPLNIAARLPVTGLEKPLAERIVCIDMRHTRPDLKLFKTIGGFPGQLFRGAEHPGYILWERETGKAWPIEILQDPDYLARLEAFRAGTWTYPDPSKQDIYRDQLRRAGKNSP